MLLQMTFHFFLQLSNCILRILNYIFLFDIVGMIVYIYILFSNFYYLIMYCGSLPVD